MVKITGKDRAVGRLRSMGPEIVRKVGAALFAGGQAIQDEAQILLTTGAVTGKGHVASLPGEPPNQNWGTLGGHIETVQVEDLKVTVSSNAPYAAALEYGTSKMAERPYMRPAVEAKRKEVTALVRAAVDSAISSQGA